MPYRIYAKTNCPYCENIKKVLTGLGESYIELTLNRDFSKEEFTSKFGYGSSFPKVLKDGKLIGGCSETIVHLRNEGRI